MTDGGGHRIAVAFLARGVGSDWEESCRRFLDSYLRHPAGVEHTLHVLYKGFDRESELRRAQGLFGAIDHRAFMLDDDKLDIGAYIDWSRRIDEDILCPLNTASEVLADHWLRKLAVNLAQPGVGLVGATASFESLANWNPVFPVFPNVHMRSTAFMVSRRTFCEYTKDIEIRDKLDAFHFESGPSSLSCHVLRSGHELRVVGKDGRGYAPTHWPISQTFRLGFQRNLLVGDNQTRNFAALTWDEKHETVERTWGRFIRDFEKLPAQSISDGAPSKTRRERS